MTAETCTHPNATYGLGFEDWWMEGVSYPNPLMRFCADCDLVEQVDTDTPSEVVDDFLDDLRGAT